jgi:hypothetical protein
VSDATFRVRGCVQNQSFFFPPHTTICVLILQA